MNKKEYLEKFCSKIEKNLTWHIHFLLYLDTKDILLWYTSLLFESDDGLWTWVPKVEYYGAKVRISIINAKIIIEIKLDPTSNAWGKVLFFLISNI